MTHSRAISNLILCLLLTGCSQMAADSRTDTPPAKAQAALEENVPHNPPVAPSEAASSLLLTAAQQQRFLQGKDLLQRGDNQAAAAHFADLAIALPAAGGVWYNLALSQWQSGELVAAVNTLQQLALNNPSYSAGHNLAGVVARQQGRFVEAEQHFKQALTAAPDNADVHKNLAFLYELYLNKPLQAHYHYKQYFALTGDAQATAWLALLEQQLPQEHTNE